MKASIKHNDSTRTDRVALELIEVDGMFVWHASAQDEDQYATDVSGETEADAINAASTAWGADCWDLQVEA